MHPIVPLFQFKLDRRESSNSSVEETEREENSSAERSLGLEKAELLIGKRDFFLLPAMAESEEVISKCLQKIVLMVIGLRRICV